MLAERVVESHCHLIKAARFTAPSSVTPNGMPLTGRQRAMRDGNQAALLLGAPVERLVRRLHAKTHYRYSVRRRHAVGGAHAPVCDSEGEESNATARPLFSASAMFPFEYHWPLTVTRSPRCDTTGRSEPWNRELAYH